jgi:hypothetical protein
MDIWRRLKGFSGKKRTKRSSREVKKSQPRDDSDAWQMPARLSVDSTITKNKNKRKTKENKIKRQRFSRKLVSYSAHYTPTVFCIVCFFFFELKFTEHR